MEYSEKKGLDVPYNWYKGITCGSYAHNLSVGDNPNSREFGTPSMTAPWFSKKI